MVVWAALGDASKINKLAFAIQHLWDGYRHSLVDAETGDGVLAAVRDSCEILAIKVDSLDNAEFATESATGSSVGAGTAVAIDELNEDSKEPS